MEEDIRKQGMLLLQHQRFGKKWKRVWSVLYRESSCSISRLEFFECKDGGSVEKNDRSLRKQQEHKKVIRLADCIRVSEVEVDGCPRDTGAFLVETTEKVFVFAAERQQLDDWTHKLCETAFPMSWAEPSVKRGTLQRGQRVEDDHGMEDNFLYSSRPSVRDFRVCVRRTEAAERCRLKGDGVLRADVDALQLMDKSGDLVLTWPYRYLRRFGRDKATFSFEAGRRCDSGEGSFEFDTKQGNFLFQAVEAAINLQRVSAPPRQSSGPDTPLDTPLPPPPVQSRMLPLPVPRGHVPQSPAAQEVEGVYSLVMEHQSAAQQRHPLARLELPVDKVLTGVKSLNLETRGAAAPRKSQVKMISSCPLPHAGPESGPAQAAAPGSALGANPRLSPKLSSSPNLDQTYSQIDAAAAKREARDAAGGGGGAGGGACTPPMGPQEPEYSLPFDTIAAQVLSSMRAPQQHAADPLYDSIDETKIRNIFQSAAVTAAAVGAVGATGVSATHKPVEHIYDEPEGCAAGAAAAAAAASRAPASLYDDPEEMRGDAWRIMGAAADPKGHEYPYNPRVDDYAVPKRPQRALPVSQSTTEEEEEEGEEPQEAQEEAQEQQTDSPYNNVRVKMM